LVLNTYGVNVWCAAGKGTFGTEELVHRIEATTLHKVANHRVLILPQLGAVGVAAHEVKKRSGFKVEYGPVRAADLPVYLKTRQATPEMRRVRFTLRDRLVLIPVELVHVLLPMAIAATALFLIIGPLGAAGAGAGVLSGVVLFPILLPWLPTHQFSTKGFILGGVVYLLGLPPVTAFLALNFTGATTFTSKSGVKREMFAYIPVMAGTFGTGVVLTITFTLFRVFG
jgi:hypothetical protein